MASAWGWVMSVEIGAENDPCGIASCRWRVHDRSFIPHRCHDTIGVFAAISAAALLPDSVLAEIAVIPDGNDKTMIVEHPGGSTACILLMPTGQ